MAKSPADGVVNKDLRAFDVDNLYVASSAALPTSGQANPTLTVMALAVRLACKLAGASRK
jgi:choline dehydrogenase-like flavoprotein